MYWKIESWKLREKFQELYGVKDGTGYYFKRKERLMKMKTEKKIKLGNEVT